MYKTIENKYVTVNEKCSKLEGNLLYNAQMFQPYS